MVDIGCMLKIVNDMFQREQPEHCTISGLRPAFLKNEDRREPRQKTLFREVREIGFPRVSRQKQVRDGWLGQN